MTRPMSIPELEGNIYRHFKRLDTWAGQCADPTELAPAAHYVLKEPSIG